MAKVKQGVASILFLTVFLSSAHAQYVVSYNAVDTDSLQLKKLSLKSAFTSRADASTYFSNLPSALRAKGFIAASIDTLQLDSAKGKVVLFLGNQYKWSTTHTRPGDQPILDAVRWPGEGTDIDFATLSNWQNKILDYLEENGHPFGKAYLDNVTVSGDRVEATLIIDKGPTYRIDSIRIYGDAKVDNEFLQKYLQIYNGSIYDARKLRSLSKKLAELSFLQEDRPADVTRLATGSVLNLYLKEKKSSQINALVGFLPNNDLMVKKRLLLTVDANVMLRNSLGSGETISLLWQQLKQGSPRINLLYDQPFIFHTSFGGLFSFDMYKQDSSYLNLNMKLGTTYSLKENQSASVFLLRRQTVVNTINTASVIQTKKLPQEADVSSVNLGFSYDQNSTDYRFNPRRGNVISITASGGTKKVKKNSQILELKDPSNPTFNFDNLYDTVKQNAYQLRVNASLAHYFSLGGQRTMKLALNTGIFLSANYFRNEMFQIGGYKLLRGFNEESQYVSQYSVGTAEFRYLIARNSAFFAFLDGGWGKHLLEARQNHSYIGTGVGLSFETKAGIINLAWALGKRDDTEWNLRQSKIHIGFASYF